MFNSCNDKVLFVRKIFCTFLTLCLVITGFFVSALAGEYTGINKSKYHLANWYGLDELPYGNDTGVVYLKTHNGVKWIDLTICFNKCSPLVDFIGDLGSATDTDTSQNQALIDNFNYTHIWGLKSGATSNGNSFYFSCISDSPVYYTYGNTGEDWKTFPFTYVSQAVWTSQKKPPANEISDSTVKRYRTIYCYLDIDLGNYGFRVNSGSKWFCYSNKLMTNNVSGNYQKDYRELYAITFNTPLDSQYEGADNYNTAKTDVLEYAYACYPSSDCLRDWSLWNLENNSYNVLLNAINNVYDIESQQLEYLIYVSEDTYQIRQLLQEISTGGQEYPSGGSFSDDSLSSQVDGVLGDVQVNTNDSQFIHTLSSSFIIIRGLWDKIVEMFGLYGVIGLLLFLAFAAYLLGRALKGRDS